jgi:hypothetical protein
MKDGIYSSSVCIRSDLIQLRKPHSSFNLDGDYGVV